MRSGVRSHRRPHQTHEQETLYHASNVQFHKMTPCDGDLILPSNKVPSRVGMPLGALPFEFCDLSSEDEAANWRQRHNARGSNKRDGMVEA